MKGECTFDAFKIRNRDFLLVTLKISNEVTELTYEILGDKGNHVLKNINTNGDSEVFITIPISDKSEQLVFKYTANEIVDFCFFNYTDLESKECEERGLEDKYTVTKNIHLVMNVEEPVHTSSSIEDGDIIEESDEFSEGSGRFSIDEMDMCEEDYEGMYRPTSDTEDMARIFNLESDHEDNEGEDEDLDMFERTALEEKDDTGSWSPIDVDVSKKNETTDVTSTVDITPDSLDSISKEA